jgi:flagellar motor protein MotB
VDAASLSSNVAQATVRVRQDLLNSVSHVAGRVMVGNCPLLPPPEGEIALRLSSSAVASHIEYRAQIGISAVAVGDLTLAVTLPEVLDYEPGSARLDGQPLPAPRYAAGRLLFELGERAPEWRGQLTFVARARGDQYGEFATHAQLEFRTGSGHRVRTAVVQNTLKDFPYQLHPRFESLAAQLKKADFAELDALLARIAGEQVLHLHVTGHTDSNTIRARARDLYRDNYTLSLARAAAVGEYLREALQLDATQLTLEGRGPDEPIATNETAEGRAQNRRVEVFFETARKRSETRFLLPLADSGVQTMKIFGEAVARSEASVGTELAGVEGIRLVMEDGRYAVSDKLGLYHFEGLQPGVHRVQVDPESVPPHLELIACEQNTRFAGNADSQFVDLQGGTLWRSDFYLAQKRPLEGEVAVRLTSRSREGGVAYRAEVEGDGLATQRRELVVRLPSAQHYVAHSTFIDGEPGAEPRLDGELLRFTLPAEAAAEWRHQLLFETRSDLTQLGEQLLAARLEYTTVSGEEGAGRWAENRLEQLPTTTQQYLFSTTFKLLDSTLTERDLRNLDESMALLRQPGVRHIRVIGHSDSLELHGSSLHRFANNYALSRQRATAVADYLRTQMALHNGQIEVVGMGPDQPIGDNETEAGRRANRRVELQVEIAAAGSEARMVLRDDDSGLVSDKVSYGVPGETAVAQVAAPQRDEQRDGILSLSDGVRVAQRIQAVRLRLDSRLKLELLLDGKAISHERIGFRMVDEKRRRTLYSFIGVDLGEAGAHTLELRGVDPFGNARYQQTVNYIRSGEIAEIRLLEGGGNVADGNTPVRIKLALLDESGEPVHAATELSLITGDLAPYLSDKERNQIDPRISRDGQLLKVDSDGVAYFAAVGKSGLYNVELGYNEVRRKVKVYVKPKYRQSWLMVGVAEGTAGYSTLSGNQESLAAGGGEEGLYSDGRLAFYAKGRIKGEWLLTMAYDSAKRTGGDRNPLFQSIAPDAYYTLYGDNSQQNFDAQSSEKLYLRLEADQFYALFGDYQTGLTVTELSNYSRSMTGVKTEYVGEQVAVTAFASDTNQAFVKDEIIGNGTSGLYRLSRRDPRMGSETVTIEVRDRFRSEKVISSRELSRYSEYNIDYHDGTLYFKEPVYSRDQNFNPTYIVVKYEVLNQAETAMVAGGRAALTLADDRLELGASLISDTTSGAPAELYGVDARYEITAETTARAEVAVSERGVGVGATSGSAYLAEVTHNGGDVSASAYVREQGAGFGIGQQRGSEESTRKLGAEGRVKLTDQVSVQAEGRREEVLSTAATRDMVSSSLTYTEELYTLGGGMRFARDETAAGSVNDSTMVTATASRTSEDRRLRGHINGEAAVGDNASSDYPSRLLYGAEYLLVESTSLFADQELTSGAAQESIMTRVGLKSSPWQNATFNTVLQEQSSEFGPRRFATMGLNQKWPLSDTLVIDFGVDHSRTLRDPGALPLNPNAPLSSGSVNSDFTAINAGVTSTHELWSANLRGESLWGEREDKRGLFAGVYRQQTPGLGLAAILEYWNRQTVGGALSTDASVELSLAYRPVSSRLILLDRLKYSLDEERGGLDNMTQYKLVNNLNANYLFDRRNQLAMHYGIKQIRDNFDHAAYDNLLMAVGAEYRHDITPKWDWGLRYSLLHDTNLGAYTHSEGLSLGYSWARNVWASVGYNENGYSDADFSAAGYTAQGVYLTLRIGLDQRTSREMMAWWEGR